MQRIADDYADIARRLAALEAEKREAEWPVFVSTPETTPIPREPPNNPYGLFIVTKEAAAEIEASALREVVDREAQKQAWSVGMWRVARGASFFFSKNTRDDDLGSD